MSTVNNNHPKSIDSSVEFCLRNLENEIGSAVQTGELARDVRFYLKPISDIRAILKYGSDDSYFDEGFLLEARISDMENMYINESNDGHYDYDTFGRHIEHLRALLEDRLSPTSDVALIHAA
jgi:hypothetical protein